MHSIVESMLDEVCEAAKQEMRDMKESELGSWQNAVTVADGTWQTRGWHSKNATFTIRNYLTGALLYYHHLCLKGRDKVIEEELYRGTSKSSEGFAARVTFQKAKEEGMHVAVHWQDADSSSAKAVREVFPNAEVMICGGDAGRAHRKILELLQKIKKAPQQMLDRYKSSYPQLGKLTHYIIVIYYYCHILLLSYIIIAIYYYCRLGKDTIHSCCGVQQGDPLGPLGLP